MIKTLAMAMVSMVLAAGCDGTTSSPMPGAQEAALIDYHVKLDASPLKPRAVSVRVGEEIVARLVFTAENFDVEQVVTLAVEGSGAAVSASLDPEGDDHSVVPGVHVGPINPAGHAVKAY